MSESDNVRAPKKLNPKKKWNFQQKKNEISKTIKSQKKWNLNKMKSQKKWNQKISEHNQCHCQISQNLGNVRVR